MYKSISLFSLSYCLRLNSCSLVKSSCPKDTWSLLYAGAHYSSTPEFQVKPFHSHKALKIRVAKTVPHGLSWAVWTMNHGQWDIPLVTLIEMATYLTAACSVSCPSALCIYLECFCNVGINNPTAQKMLSLAPPRYVWIQSPCSFYGSVIFEFPPHSSTNFSCVLFGFQSIRPHWPFAIITCTREKEISRTLESWLIEIWADMHTKGSHPY